MKFRKGDRVRYCEKVVHWPLEGNGTYVQVYSYDLHIVMPDILHPASVDPNGVGGGLLFLGSELSRIPVQDPPNSGRLMV